MSTHLGGRALGVVVLLLIGPVFAELLSTYLDTTGAIAESVFLVLFLAPLYGGAALVIREVALRRGLGWPGRLTMATAFGVAMPTVVDHSIYQPTNAAVPYWNDLMASAEVGGFSVFAYLGFIVGHVAVSLGAPLVLAESLVPSVRDRTWLPTWGVIVVAVAALLVAVSISATEPGDLNAARWAVPAVVVVALVALALSPFGAPSGARIGTVGAARVPRPAVLGVLGLAAMGLVDFAPFGWPGVALVVVSVTVVTVLVHRWCRRTSWSPQHVAALAFGAVLARTVAGTVAPPSAGVDPTDKYLQNALLITFVIGCGLIVRHRLQGQASETHP